VFFSAPDLTNTLTWALGLMALALGVQLFGVAGSFFALVVALLVAVLVSRALGQRTRRRLDNRDPKFKPTNEVFMDHGSGTVMRVHVNPDTGERRYWKDR
jgi:hypothetical protein